MNNSARISLLSGLSILGLSIINGLLADQFYPELVRAEALAALAGVGLMLVATLWTQSTPISAKKQPLTGEEGFYLNDGLSGSSREELAWGTNLMLTATAAATILVYWDQTVISRRGVLGSGRFIPGVICHKVQKTGELLSLAKSTLFPGSGEFDPVLENLPSIMIYPLSKRGWVIVGGWSERCFSRSDERWFVGWCLRLRNSLENA